MRKVFHWTALIMLMAQPTKMLLAHICDFGKAKKKKKKKKKKKPPGGPSFLNFGGAEQKTQKKKKINPVTKKNNQQQHIDQKHSERDKLRAPGETHQNGQNLKSP
eukprot:TRINITY_DN28975_c0_g1_i2.p4 TRINITY_DN28975_c0_g1~~TRINITY_DN28975_c0_g1_i2.p4  ORF type:complete len:105 (+),score=28.52 TRINITY_DN28975_c0_g1_i2:534-848(+)